jgi:tetratricopeptide (TPR) repeat protein
MDKKILCSLYMHLQSFSRILAILAIGSCLAGDIAHDLGNSNQNPAGPLLFQLNLVNNESPLHMNLCPKKTPLSNEILKIKESSRKKQFNPKIFETLIEPENEYVKYKAKMLASRYPGDHNIEQICCIYQYLKIGSYPIDGWSYVSDKRGDEDYSYANFTLKIGQDHISGVGDCDDFAIAISSLIEAIGGTTRITLAYNGNANKAAGHAYAEVYLGSLSTDREQIELIKEWLKKKYATDEIYYNISEEENGNVWLNLDWSANHPGGIYWPAKSAIIIPVRPQFEKTVQRLPGDIFNKTESYILIDKGLALINLSKYDEAIQAWDKALEIYPTCLVALNNKGFTLSLYKGEYEKAIENFDKALEINPQYGEALVYKGFALGNLGKYDEAIRAYDEALEINPQLIEAWTGKGLVFNSLHRYNEAIKAYDEALKINPHLAAAWSAKALPLSALGRHDEAKQVFENSIVASEEILAINPNLEWAWMDKGLAFFGLGKYDEAINAYDEALRIRPKLANAWSGKGYAFCKQSKYNEAINAFDEALETNPRLTDALISKGFALNLLGKYDEAIKVYDKALETNPQQAGIWYTKGSIFQTQGKYDESLNAFNKALEIDPQLGAAWYGKGQLFNSMGLYDDAVQAYDKAIQIDQRKPVFWIAKGDALSSLGRYNEALEAYNESLTTSEEALKKNPNLEWETITKSLALSKLEEVKEIMDA